jgi:uncharacterized membrane protein YhaH (DUF805 family)
MKRCGYCGKDSNDASTHCGGCGSPFAPNTDGSPNGLGRNPHSAQAVALATGLGIMLIATALFFCVGRAFGELWVHRGGASRGSNLMYSFVTSSAPAPFIALAAAWPAFAICRRRCRQRPVAVATASLTVVALVMLSLLPMLAPVTATLWCVPAFMWSGSPTACYAGAMLQVAGGAWILFWFRPPEPEDARTPTQPVG